MQQIIKKKSNDNDDLDEINMSKSTTTSTTTKSKLCQFYLMETQTFYSNDDLKYFKTNLDN